MMPAPLAYIQTHFERLVSEPNRAPFLVSLNGVRNMPGMTSRVLPVLERLLSIALPSTTSASSSWLIRLARSGTSFATEENKADLAETILIGETANVVWIGTPASTVADWTSRCDTTQELLSELHVVAPSETWIKAIFNDLLNALLASLPDPFQVRAEADIAPVLHAQLLCLCDLVLFAFVFVLRISPKQRLVKLREPLERVLGVCSIHGFSFLCERVMIALVMLRSESLSSSLYFSRLQPTWEAAAANGTLSMDSALCWLYVYAYVGQEENQYLQQIHESTPRKRPQRSVTARPIRYDESSDLFEDEQDIYHWDKIGQVYLAKSQISATQDTGTGVFALVDFERGDVITQYCGTYYKVLPKTLAHDPHTPYLMEFVYDPDTHPKQWAEQFRAVYIDGETDSSKCTSRQVGQFLQDPRDKMFVNSEMKFLPAVWVPPEYRDDKECLHGKALPKNPLERLHFFTVAQKRIPKGSEIYMNYNYKDEVYDRFGMVAKEAETLRLPPPIPLNPLKK